MAMANPAASIPDQPRWTEYRPLDDVQGAPRNPKRHDEALMDGSIDEFGFVESTTMDERTGRLVVGHGRLESLKRHRDAGDPAPDGIVVADDGTWMIPVARGWASRDDDHAEAYLVLSNEGPGRGGWDHDELAGILSDLNAADLGHLTGFTDDAYQQIIQDAGLLGDAASDFLSDLTAPDDDVTPAPAPDRHRTGTDAVDFRLAMSQAERDEVIALLRAKQREHGAETLADTLLQVLRLASVPA